MCSITEPRRVTVSCKHLFSSFTNDRSTTTTNQIFNGTKVFHIPFDTKTKYSSNNHKSLRTSLNPLSPIFYSYRHTEFISK